MSCLVEFDNLCDFISHLKLHIKDGVKVACPFSGCKRQFTNISSFSAHKCRCHKDWTSNHISVDNEVGLHVENSTSNDTVDGHIFFRDDHSQIETEIDDPTDPADNLQDILSTVWHCFI